MRLHKTSAGWFLEADRGSIPLPSFSLDRWLADGADLAALSHPGRPAPSLPPSQLPLESQEVWAAGVTYLRSKTARMEESQASASAYDRVYEAARPELFFKATPGRCVGPGGALLLRTDSKWMVPEPELVLVISSTGRIAGFTIGNDLSCRDIEGENSLYLPQAKIWQGCCALGPAILVNDGTFDIRQSTISLDIVRNGKTVFTGSTPISRIKRTFDELVGYLFRHQSFPVGVMLLTGTGIVPPDDFSLRAGDEVRMSIPEIGTLSNPCE